MTGSSAPPSLNIERRGEQSFALVRADGEHRTELLLTETDVLLLSRIFPSYAHALIARRNPSTSDVQAWLTIPATFFELTSDLHNELVLLRLRDETDAEFGFSFAPSGARDLGNSLKNWADKVEGSAPHTRQ
jgi:hypothetical protein